MNNSPREDLFDPSKHARGVSRSERQRLRNEASLLSWIEILPTDKEVAAVWELKGGPIVPPPRGLPRGEGGREEFEARRLARNRERPDRVKEYIELFADQSLDPGKIQFFYVLSVFGLLFLALFFSKLIMSWSQMLQLPSSEH
jgi:hypothetical protein